MNQSAGTLTRSLIQLVVGSTAIIIGASPALGNLTLLYTVEFVS